MHIKDPLYLLPIIMMLLVCIFSLWLIWTKKKILNFRRFDSLIANSIRDDLRGDLFLWLFALNCAHNNIYFIISNCCLYLLHYVCCSFTNDHHSSQFKKWTKILILCVFHFPELDWRLHIFSIWCFFFSFACLPAYLSVCSIQVAAVCWLAPTLSYLPLVGPGAKRFIKFRASTARLLFFCGANHCWLTQTRGSRSRSKGGDKRARHKTRPTRINEIIYGIMWNKLFQ